MKVYCHCAFGHGLTIPPFALMPHHATLVAATNSVVGECLRLENGLKVASKLLHVFIQE